VASGEDRTLAYARQLEVDDGRLAEEIGAVVAVETEATALRERALDAEAFLAELPAQLDAAAGAFREAETELEVKRKDVARADSELTAVERGRDAEALAAARRAVVRGRDAAAMAEKKLERAQASIEGLERRARAIDEDVPRLTEQASLLAERAGRIRRLSQGGAAAPEPGLQGTIAWCARALAALLVARSGLESEREGVVRQANELAASVLGEPLAATSAIGARERLEAALEVQERR